MHFLIQVPFAIEHGLFPKPTLSFDFKEIKKVLSVSIPRTLTLGSDNISAIFLLSLASTMTVGSIAVFNLSYNLQAVLLSIVGVSYSLAAFPILIKYFSEGDMKKFVEQVVLSAQHIIFWSIPCSVLFIVLRAQIVRTILGAGQFNWDQTRLTAASLALFVVSIVFQNITLLFVRAYYAAGNTKKPFIAKFINAISTVALGYVFVVLYQKVPVFKDILETLFRVKNVPGTIILALPLGWSVGEALNCLTLFVLFEKDYKGFFKSIFKTLLHTLLASLVMGFVSYISLNIFAGVFNQNTLFGIFMQGFVSGIIGIIFGIITLLAVGNKEIIDVWQTLKSKIFKARIIPAEPTRL